VKKPRGAKPKNFMTEQPSEGTGKQAKRILKSSLADKNLTGGKWGTDLTPGRRRPEGWGENEHFPGGYKNNKCLREGMEGLGGEKCMGDLCAVRGLTR